MDSDAILQFKTDTLVCAAWGSKPQANRKTWKSTKVDSKAAMRAHIRPILLKSIAPCFFRGEKLLSTNGLVEGFAIDGDLDCASVTPTTGLDIEAQGFGFDFYVEGVCLFGVG
jgi:hypothetical protein